MQTSERSMLLAVGSIARHQLTTKGGLVSGGAFNDTMVTTLLSAASAIIVAAPILTQASERCGTGAVIPTSHLLEPSTAILITMAGLIFYFRTWNNSVLAVPIKWQRL